MFSRSAVHFLRWARYAITASISVIPWCAFGQCPPAPYNVPTRVFEPILPRPGAAILANPLTGETPDVLTIVALGDSVMWGNGLKNPKKFVYLAGLQIADKTQRKVQIVSYAHSGANLAYHPSSPNPPSPTNGYVPFHSDEEQVPPGDLNSSYPTTREQASCAAAVYPKAEIVFLNGCINEIGPMEIALPPIANSTSKEEIERRVRASCSEPMRETLVDVQNAFPRATIIVMNYYQIVSAKSSVLKAAPGGQSVGSAGGSSEKALEQLAKRELDFEQMRHATLQTEARDKRAVVQHWSENSIAFLRSSQSCFEWAIAAASNSSQEPGNPEDPCPPPSDPLPQPNPDIVRQGKRTYLATVENRPEYAYGGNRKHLWSLPVRFLFWVIHRDDMYGEREHVCNSHYRNSWLDRDICKVNPVAHPNREGARAFACSIVLDPTSRCEPQQPGILDKAWAK